jgi:hypothetical protein
MGKKLHEIDGFMVAKISITPRLAIIYYGIFVVQLQM